MSHTRTRTYSLMDARLQRLDGVDADAQPIVASEPVDVQLRIAEHDMELRHGEPPRFVIDCQIVGTGDEIGGLLQLLYGDGVEIERDDSGHVIGWRFNLAAT